MIFKVKPHAGDPAGVVGAVLLRQYDDLLPETFAAELEVFDLDSAQSARLGKLLSQIMEMVEEQRHPALKGFSG